MVTAIMEAVTMENPMAFETADLFDSSCKAAEKAPLTPAAAGKAPLTRQQLERRHRHRQLQ